MQPYTKLSTPQTSHFAAIFHCYKLEDKAFVSCNCKFPPEPDLPFNTNTTNRLQGIDSSFYQTSNHPSLYFNVNFGKCIQQTIYDFQQYTLMTTPPNQQTAPAFAYYVLSDFLFLPFFLKRLTLTLTLDSGYCSVCRTSITYLHMHFSVYFIFNYLRNAFYVRCRSHKSLLSSPLIGIYKGRYQSMVNQEMTCVLCFTQLGIVLPVS